MYLGLHVKEERYFFSSENPLKIAIVLLGLLKYKTTHFSEKCLTIIKKLLNTFKNEI